jgi:hypothetical protein
LRSSLSSIPDAITAAPFDHDVHHRGFWPKQLMAVWSLLLQSGSEGPSFISRTARRLRVFMTQCQDLPCAAAANLASTRAEHHLAFTSGLTTARVVLMNSSASGLSVRFFKVVMAIVPRALSKATGNALSEGCLPGNINV